MRVLAVADEEAKVLYDYYRPGILDEYELILACGDLKRSYLEFLVTMAHCPVVYVPGNHDDWMEKKPPEGCLSADNRILVYQGIRILGLGGCHKYRNGTYMYTEKEMAWRILRLAPALMRHRGFDILITHAPARHINDMDSMSHRGFECFGRLLEKYRPAFFVHGHIHRNYGVKIPRVTRVGDTQVINACEYYAFDYPDEVNKASMKKR